MRTKVIDPLTESQDPSRFRLRSTQGAFGALLLYCGLVLAELPFLMGAAWPLLSRPVRAPVESSSGGFILLTFVELCIRGEKWQHLARISCVAAKPKILFR